MISLDPLKPYLRLIECGAVAIAVLWAYTHVYHTGYNAAVAAQAKADAIALDQHQKDLQTAEHSHDAEIADLSRYVSDHAVSVRVCTPAKSVQGAGTSGTGTSASTGPILAVSAPDSGGGRDIGPMLSALAAAADHVSADLRAQQAVK